MIKLANKIALASILGGDEGMEKKALSLADLLRMSRNAANKGKLRRFSELLDKRNRAIGNVAQVRRDVAHDQWPWSYMEGNLLGHFDGPEMKTRQRLVNRFVAANGDPADVKRVIDVRDKTWPSAYDRATAELDLSENVAGPWTLKDLAKYSIRQSKTNPIDKLTYPVV